jgi:hypothetical protein
MLVGACFVKDFLFVGERDTGKDVFLFGERDPNFIEKELAPFSSRFNVHMKRSFKSGIRFIFLVIQCRINQATQSQRRAPFWIGRIAILYLRRMFVWGFLIGYGAVEHDGYIGRLSALRLARIIQESMITAVQKPIHQIPAAIRSIP